MKAFFVLLLLTLCVYFSLTWYFFGSSKPCEILRARMLPHRTEMIRSEATRLEREHSELGQMTKFEDPNIRKLLEEYRKRVEQAPEIAVKELREEISRLGPIQCIYRAITWVPSTNSTQQ